MWARPGSLRPLPSAVAGSRSWLGKRSLGPHSGFLNQNLGSHRTLEGLEHICRVRTPWAGQWLSTWRQVSVAGAGWGRWSAARGRRPRRQHGRNPSGSQAARLTPWGEDPCRRKRGLGAARPLGGVPCPGLRRSRTLSPQQVTARPGTSSVGLSDLNTRQKRPCVLTCQRLKRHKTVGPGASLVLSFAPAICRSWKAKVSGHCPAPLGADSRPGQGRGAWCPGHVSGGSSRRRDLSGAPQASRGPVTAWVSSLTRKRCWSQVQCDVTGGRFRVSKARLKQRGRSQLFSGKCPFGVFRECPSGETCVVCPFPIISEKVLS